MWRAVVLILLAGTAAACNPLEIREEWRVDPPANAEAAIAMVTASYGTTSRPNVIWYGPQAVADSPECATETVDLFRPGHMSASYRSTAGNCVSGEGWANDVVLLAPAEGETIFDSSLAHELGHWRWDADGHPDWIFSPGVPGRVTVAEDELGAAGL